MATLTAAPHSPACMRLAGSPPRTPLSPTPPSSAPRLDALPRDVLLRVLSMLSYEEVAAARATCRSVARAAEEVLARAFDSFGALLLRRIRDLRLAPDFSFYTCLVCKTLYQIEIEYRLLRAAVGVYVREGSAPFVGGRLLDLLREALRLSGAPPPPRDVSPTPSSPSSPAHGTSRPVAFADLFTPDIVDEMSSLVEQYISFFEKEVEPRLRSPTPLSVKLVDVLDAFVGGASDAEMRTHGGWRSLRARYYLPLTGLMFHDEDPEPTTRLVVPESEARTLLAALREAARKSGQRYVSALLQRELASTEARRGAAHAGLFAARRRCVARDRLQFFSNKSSSPLTNLRDSSVPVVCCCLTSSGGVAACTGSCAMLRERLERRPLRDPPPPERDRDSLVLRAAVRLRFLLNQRPLEADCLGVPLDECASMSNTSGGSGSDCSDPGTWGWAQGSDEDAPPPDGGNPPFDDARSVFWFQLEVHRLPPGTSSQLVGPVPALGPAQGPRRRLSFQPARFRRVRVSTGASDERVLSVALRDVCVSYAAPLPPSPPHEARVSVTYGRLRRVPSAVSMPDVPLASPPALTPTSVSSLPTPLGALHHTTSPSSPTTPASTQSAPCDSSRAFDEALGALHDARSQEGGALAQLRRVLTAAASASVPTSPVSPVSPVQPATPAPSGTSGATQGRGGRAGAGEEGARVDELARRVAELLGPVTGHGSAARTTNGRANGQRTGGGEEAAWKAAAQAATATSQTEHWRPQ